MGKLYVVPTPVGNLKDMTFRAVEVLNHCDLILAEDTRTSGILLRHFEIQTRTQAYHMHNEHKTLSRFISQMEEGSELALISDAGTPAISDPGFLLVRECIRHGIEVECLPGATAFVPALVCSGLPNDKFVFEGFLPVKKGRRTRLDILAEETRTMVFYESPHKIIRTLNDLSGSFGEDRQASVSREISKKFEEHIRGSLKEIASHFEINKPKGEFVLVVEGKP